MIDKIRRDIQARLEELLGEIRQAPPGAGGAHLARERTGQCRSRNACGR